MSMCYRFDRFTAECSLRGGGQPQEASVSGGEGGVAMSVDVGGLMSHTLYQCEVTVTLTGIRSLVTFDHMTLSDQALAFTFPDGTYILYMHIYTCTLYMYFQLVVQVHVAIYIIYIYVHLNIDVPVCV